MPVRSKIDSLSACAFGCASVLAIIIIFNKSQGLENIALTFPDGFLIGTASSAYQVEGAWNVSGEFKRKKF